MKNILRWIKNFFLPERLYPEPKQDEEMVNRNVQRVFKEALQALSISAEAQVQCTEPGDVPEELINDYHFIYDTFLNRFQETLSPATVEHIKELDKALDALPDSVFQETNLLSMQQPEWESIRAKAQRTLKALDWAIEAPPSYVHEGEGVYRRNGDTKVF